MTSNSLKLLDPVQGLVDFVLDIKPYHTKIVEVLIEYVYHEFADITIVDDINTTVDLFYPALPANQLMPLACDGGYGTRSFGDPGKNHIISPNPTVAFESYPAINAGNNTFIVTGDRVSEFKSGVTVYLVSIIEDYSNVHSIYGVEAGVADISNPPSFFVVGDQTTQFVDGYLFEVNGTQQNDRSYSVIGGATYSGVTNLTKIPVGQSILGDVPHGQLGVVRVGVPANSGEFTVELSTFNPGMIDSWPDVTTPSSFLMGDDAHTVVSTIEPLTAIPVLSPMQIYVSYVTVAPIIIEGMLSYSNHTALYQPSIPEYTQTPDEGVNQRNIVGVVASTDDGFGSPIPNSGKFTISGNFSVSNVFVGDTFTVSGSENNGTYTIASIVYDDIRTETTFGVNNIVVGGDIAGTVTVVVQSNVFVVDGDWTKRFTQGVEFNITGGTTRGANYKVVTSAVVNEKTYIRVLGDIIDSDMGLTILATTNGYVVRGNKTGLFLVGVKFNVVGSAHNDGSYVVDAAGSTYDVDANTTTISILGTIEPTASGSIHVFSVGMIADVVYGYGENKQLCDYVPETVVRVSFAEHIKFTGGHLDLSDDLLVYNMENNDTWGYELPIDSIISSTSPTILEQLTAPLVFSISDLWYDLTTDIFRQFNGVEWGSITTAWWMDTTNDVLYYRTKNKFIDTGWVLDSTQVPGFGDFIPAVGKKEVIATEQFTTRDLGGGVTLDTFTLATAIPNANPNLIRVTINQVPAGIVINSSTEFTLLHPDWVVGDLVDVTVYDFTKIETNAHVIPCNLIPHVVYHDNVMVDATNDAYVVGGGNFMERFSPNTKFEGVQDGKGGGILGSWTPITYPILSVDGELGTITLGGDLAWLFLVDRVFTIRTSQHNSSTFVVSASLFDGTYTTVAVASPSLTTSPSTLPNQRYFYNPGVVIYNIDEVSDTIIVLGNVVDAYTPGMELIIDNSTLGNNQVWVVSSAVYDNINNRTNIGVVGDIPDPDVSAQATLHTPIFQNYSRDLGVVLGAVYDPDVNGVYATNQVKTIVATTSVVNVNTTGITYQWIGPVQFDIAQVRSNSFITTMADSMGVTDALLSMPDRFSILDTNDDENYFVVSHTDPVTGLPIDLTGSFTARTIFDVVGSYSNGVESTSETNDAKYVVLRTFYDYEKLKFTATGSETKVPMYPTYGAYDIYRNSTLLVEGVDYGDVGDNTLCFGDVDDCFGLGTPLVAGEVISQVPTGIPITWSTGSNRTFVQIDTNYDNIPPYNSFNVVGVSNNGASPNTVRLSGNHVTLINNFTNPVFRIDQPLVNTNPVLNVFTVTNVAYDSNTVETVLTIGEELIDESFTGALGMIEVAYSGDVFYDANNVTLPWIHGDILREDQTTDTLTSATISDDLTFGWGTVERWPIDTVDNVANLETFDADGNVGTPDVRLYRGEIAIDTDITSILEVNDRISIIGSQGNDDRYEIAAMVYDVGLTDTIITLRNKPKTFRITTTADVLGGLDGTYFLVSSATTDYYVWLDVDNGGSDPLVSGRTGISVHVVVGSSADTISTNLAYAIDSTAEFSATSSANVVTIHALSSLEPLQYARDLSTGFVVDNYTIPHIPTSQLGYVELKGIDITNWFQYTVREYNPSTNEILINGSGIGDVQSGQQIRVIGTQFNDSVFTIGLTPTFDPSGYTTIPVVETVAYGVNSVVELISQTSIKVLGDSYRFTRSGDTINIINSVGNNGAYTVTGTLQDGPHTVVDVTPSLPNITPDGVMQYMERGGWIESLRYQGIHIIHEDWIGVSMTEQADAAVLTEGGSVVGSWDYPQWDVGSFDESLGTVIHLYSNVFAA